MIWKHVTYVKIYMSMLQHDLISILPEFIVYISNQNALFIQRETQSYFPRSNLLYILPQIKKKSGQQKHSRLFLH